LLAVLLGRPGSPPFFKEETNMARCNLRVYYGPEEATCTTLNRENTGKRSVTLSLGEILPLLADAYQSQRTWLRDFTDEEVTVSTDLYEVLLAYRHYRRPSA
jgi:hypothetical protein